MTTTDYNDAVMRVTEKKRRSIRTVVVGKIKAITRELLGERDAIFESGIGQREAGVEKADGLVPGAPVLQLAGGGFSIYIPLGVNDEAVGLVSDRPLDKWRKTKLPGMAPPVPRDRQHHDLSDTMLLPFTFTLPVGGPTLGGLDLVIAGPLGDVLRVSKLDNSIVLTKQSADPLTLATITMNALGGIEMTVPTGQVIAGGDAMAESLVKLQALLTAMTAMLAAGAATPPSPLAGNNGSLAFNAAKIAWDAAIADLGTIKMFGS